MREQSVCLWPACLLCIMRRSHVCCLATTVPYHVFAMPLTGKDRTGLVAMLLLLLCGVERQVSRGCARKLMGLSLDGCLCSHGWVRLRHERGLVCCGMAPHGMAWETQCGS